jgi:hypothetical protein
MTRALTSITRAPNISDDRWTAFVNDVRDSVSAESIAIVSASGPVTGQDSAGWVAEYFDADVPTARAALREIAQWYGQDVTFVVVQDVEPPHDSATCPFCRDSPALQNCSAHLESHKSGAAS